MLLVGRERGCLGQFTSPTMSRVASGQACSSSLEAVGHYPAQKVLDKLADLLLEFIGTVDAT